MKDTFIDLHMHSTASDGTTPPEELIRQIRYSIRRHDGVYNQIVMALTDHDTLAGIPALQAAAAKEPDVTVIPGVEISTNYKSQEIHILGYGMDPADEALNQALAYYRDGRMARNKSILAKFADLDILIPEEDLKVKEGETPGRPHIARWLLEHGHVDSIQEAFDKYLAAGAACYVDRVKMPLKETVEVIRAAGGIAFLAHPIQYKSLSRSELEELVDLLCEAGLTGMECYYTEFNEEETAYLEDLADRHGLLKSGGSDYHGENKPEIELGYGWGNLGLTMEKIQAREILFAFAERQQA